MRAKNQRTLDAFKRVQAFLATHRARLGAIPSAQGASELDAAVAMLERHALTQERWLLESNGLLARQRALEKELRKVHLQPIAGVARARVRLKPEHRVLTRGTSELSGRSLIAEARAIAATARRFVDDFTTAGMPSDLVEQLLAVADQLEQAMDARASLKAQRAAATQGVAEETRNGHAALKSIEAVILGQFAKDARFLSEWRAARRVRSA